MIFLPEILYLVFGSPESVLPENKQTCDYEYAWCFKKEVEDLEQMLENDLPSWIKKPAEDVLQKKMLRELELADSFLH